MLTSKDRTTYANLIVSPTCVGKHKLHTTKCWIFNVPILKTCYLLHTRKCNMRDRKRTWKFHTRNKGWRQQKPLALMKWGYVICCTSYPSRIDRCNWMAPLQAKRLNEHSNEIENIYRLWQPKNFWIICGTLGKDNTGYINNQKTMPNGTHLDPLISCSILCTKLYSTNVTLWWQCSSKYGWPANLLKLQYPGVAHPQMGAELQFRSFESA